MQLEAIKNIIFKSINILISKILHSSYLSFNNPINVLICDSFIASTSLFISIQLRVGVDFFDSSYVLLCNNVLVFGLVSTSIFIWFRTNNQSLDYIGKLLLVILLSNIVFIPLMYFMNCNNGLPFTLLIINIFVMIVLLVGFRLIYYNFIRNKHYTLLIGNNESIISFLNLYTNTIFSSLKNVGIINNDPNKIIDQRITIPVVGSIVNLKDIIHLIHVNQIIITDDNLSNDDKNTLFNLSQQYKILLVHIYTSISK